MLLQEAVAENSYFILRVYDNDTIYLVTRVQSWRDFRFSTAERREDLHFVVFVDRSLARLFTRSRFPVVELFLQ